MCSSDLTALRVGAFAGGLAGLILPSLSEADDSRYYSGGALVGAAVGTAIAHSMVRPRRATSREVLREASLPRGGGAVGAASASRVPDSTDDAADRATRSARVQWQLDPAGLAMAAARAPGRHGILSITF